MPSQAVASNREERYVVRTRVHGEQPVSVVRQNQRTLGSEAGAGAVPVRRERAVCYDFPVMAGT